MAKQGSADSMHACADVICSNLERRLRLMDVNGNKSTNASANDFGEMFVSPE